MIRQSKYLLLLFLSLLLNDAKLQTEEISSKKDELNKLKSDIIELEQDLAKKNVKEKESYSAVETYSKQGHLLNKLIGKLRDEEKLKDEQIHSSTVQIKQLEDKIGQLQKNYAKYVIAVYKYGRMDDYARWLYTESVDKALIRYKYLNTFSRQRKNDLEDLKQTKSSLIASKIILENDKKEKTLLAAQKEREEVSLKEKLTEKKRILSVIKRDKTELKKEIDAKRKAEGTIKNLIAKLIEKERKRKEELERLAKLEREKKTVKDSPETEVRDEMFFTKNLPAFSQLKGNMLWPVNKGTIIQKFGENKNKTLNTVTLNYGIDIRTNPGTEVKSVADGIISAIDWIPGYGSVIIITHKDEYRTVYSHLSEIFVKEGDIVRPGSLIAKVGESLQGNILHFEIWNSRTTQNPEAWLTKK